MDFRFRKCFGVFAALLTKFFRFGGTSVALFFLLRSMPWHSARERLSNIIGQPPQILLRPSNFGIGATRFRYAIALGYLDVIVILIGMLSLLGLHRLLAVQKMRSEHGKSRCLLFSGTS